MFLTSLDDGSRLLVTLFIDKALGDEVVEFVAKNLKEGWSKDRVAFEGVTEGFLCDSGCTAICFSFCRFFLIKILGLSIMVTRKRSQVTPYAFFCNACFIFFDLNLSTSWKWCSVKYRDHISEAWSMHHMQNCILW